MKSNIFKQCWIIKRDENNSQIMDQVWIPEEFAIIGKYIKIKRDGEWSDGWLVSSLGTSLEISEVMKAESNYRTQRKGSDASRNKDGILVPLDNKKEIKFEID